MKKKTKSRIIYLLSEDKKNVLVFKKFWILCVKIEEIDKESFLIQSIISKRCECPNCIERIKMELFIKEIGIKEESAPVMYSESTEEESLGKFRNNVFEGLVSRFLKEFEAFSSTDSYIADKHSTILMFSENSDDDSSMRCSATIYGRKDNISTLMALSRKNNKDYKSCLDLSYTINV